MKRFYDISLLGQHTKKYLFHRVDCNLKTDDYIISDMIFIAPSNRIPIQSTVFETVPRFPKIVSIDQHLMLRNLLITTEDVNPANMEVNFPTGILFAIHLPTPHNLLNPFFNPLRSLEAFLATNFTKDPKVMKSDLMDAVDAILPAGTLSGAPKLRAMEIINVLENNKRGVYGGAIGYLDFTGNLDTCIAIRLAFRKNGKVFIRSGAGIVADSVPENEYYETVNKALAVINAIKEAE